jgi:predicted dehydrogenase/threonine dehydrogenase-like Zn-dependent dehydrogenase
MKQVLIKKGQAYIQQVPSPNVEKGKVLVNVLYSCISVGTEMSGVKSSGLPLWKRAMKQPDNVKKVLESVTNIGIQKTIQLVQGQLEAGNITGYSASGRVIEVGEGITDLKVGDLVACAGAQYAHHAEIICVPRNLVVLVPQNLSMDYASTVTLGAIAMQGLRRANTTLGETFVVVGLGVLGQITTQLLKSSGCKVIALDLDPSRVQTAIDCGANLAVNPLEENYDEQVIRLTGGVGADGVIITAASNSDEIISSAFRMCRKKGRVVLVGDVGLNLKRSDFYAKELDLFISCSYGPGRYDDNYEEKGLDYPVGYVRWTENRNMQSYIDMLLNNKMDLTKFPTKYYKIDDASNAYEDLKQSTQKPLLSFLEYPANNEAIIKTILNPKGNNPKNGVVRIGLVGAGGFAKGMHLPNLQALSNQFHLQAVMSRTGHNASATASRYGAIKATTDFDEILNDSEIDAVIISTRHNLHAQMALKSLKAGKHVLLEKPLALRPEDMQEIVDFFSFDFNPKPILLTGFNRRFSPYMNIISEMVLNRSNPLIINYRMNAGFIPLNHWVHGEEGGGRNIGEACHIYDLFTFLTGSKVCSISASPIRPKNEQYAKTDNFVTTLTFEDGSVASLTYTALGNKTAAKEVMEIFFDGKVIQLDDYKKIAFFGTKGRNISTSIPEKGQKNELIAFGNAIQRSGEWPIPLWHQIQATEISFEVENLIKNF